MIVNIQKKSVEPSKKAQASMEFLMTYGWALLVVLLAIGALTYFNSGITKQSSEICSLSAGFGCSEFKINTNAITIVLRNGLGKDINSGAIVQVTDSSGTSCQSSPTTSTWVDGASQNFILNQGFCNYSPNKKFNGNIQIIYSAVSSSLSRTSTGKLGGVSTTSTGTCNDTDSTVYPTIQPSILGTTKYNTLSDTDVCETSSILREYYCAGPSSIYTSTSIPCIYGCSNGICNAASGSPNFTISNIQVTDGFYCDLESPPVTFTVTNSGTVAGVPAITYYVNDAYYISLTPTPTSIAPGNSVNFALNMNYDWQGVAQWQATITTNPGETKISSLYGCQPS